MQILFDVFPLIVFFVAYSFFGIYSATAALMATMAAQVAYQWLRHRKVSNLLLGATVVVWVFGAITLILRNPIFIQWKPTVVNWLFALVFLGSHWVGTRKTLIERTMSESFELEPALWRQLSAMWIVAFIVFGAANLFFVYNFSEEIWVRFHVFGFIGLMVLFAAIQGVWLYFKLPDDQPQQDQ